jgi:hypothetical protein
VVRIRLHVVAYLLTGMNVATAESAGGYDATGNNMTSDAEEWLYSPTMSPEEVLLEHRASVNLKYHSRFESPLMVKFFKFCRIASLSEVDSRLHSRYYCTATILL